MNTQLDSAIAKIHAARSADYMFPLTHSALARILTPAEHLAWDEEKAREDEEV